jgi:hypothetical protein
MLAERRLNARHPIQGNRVAKELSRAFCERIEGERLRWANKWNFCGATSEKSFLASFSRETGRITEADHVILVVCFGHLSCC